MRMDVIAQLGLSAAAVLKKASTVAGSGQHKSKDAVLVQAAAIAEGLRDNGKLAAAIDTPAKLFASLLHGATSAHILHLQATSFAEHMALDSLYKSLPDLVDGLIEAYQGKHGIVADYPSGYRPPDKSEQFVADLSANLASNRSALGDTTEIQNLVDEIVALFDVTLYKLRNLR